LSKTEEALTGSAQTVEKEVTSGWRQPVMWLWLIVFGMLAAKTVFSLNIFWQIFNYAFQVDESESMIVAETVMMTRGVDIFALPTPERFISAPYTPFYYWLNLPFIAVTGVSFKPGRLLSFLAAGGIALLIFRFVLIYARAHLHARRVSFFPAILATLTWTSLGVVAFWSSAVKPDMTALFFNVLGLYLVFSYELRATSYEPEKAFSIQHSAFSLKKIIVNRQSSIVNLTLAAILFALAAFTKQTAFAGVLVVLAWLLVQGRFKTLAWWTPLYLFLAFAPMFLLNVLSNGGFWWHVVTVHELPWNLQSYLKFMGGYVQSYQLFGVVALGLAAFWLADVFGAGKNFWREARRNPATFLLLYAGAGIGAGLSTGTYGGNHNHFLEMSAAACMALGAVFVRLDAWWRRSASAKWRLQRWLVVPALALVLWQGVGLLAGEARLKDVPLPGWGDLQAQFLNPDWLGLEYRAPLERQRTRYAEVAAFMNNDSGRYIYSDNVSLMLATTKEIFTTDPFTQTHATFYGRWDESRFIEMIRSGQFSLIVLRESIERRLDAGQRAGDIFLSPGLARAVAENYRLACRDIVFIYVPKNRTDFKGC
jgi:4-amino-4-deoxy-L-arabinose transferase-like glycosyltransferase